MPKLAKRRTGLSSATKRRGHLTAVQRSEALMFLQSAREKVVQIPADEWPPDGEPYGPRMVVFLACNAINGAIRKVGGDGALPEV
jgi:hypothetical protein